MLLGTKQHTAGNLTRYVIDYTDWLDEGESVATCTVVLNPAFTIPDITIGAASVLSSKKVLFTLSGGSLNEIFTLDVEITNSRSEVKNDTLGFRIVAP
jgi:hypothetical protein